jgi:hypothetical protein
MFGQMSKTLKNVQQHKIKTIFLTSGKWSGGNMEQANSIFRRKLTLIQIDNEIKRLTSKIAENSAKATSISSQFGNCNNTGKPMFTGTSKISNSVIKKVDLECELKVFLIELKEVIELLQDPIQREILMLRYGRQIPVKDLLKRPILGKIYSRSMFFYIKESAEKNFEKLLKNA